MLPSWLKIQVLYSGAEGEGVGDMPSCKLGAKKKGSYVGRYAERIYVRNWWSIYICQECYSVSCVTLFIVSQTQKSADCPRDKGRMDIRNFNKLLHCAGGCL